MLRLEDLQLWFYRSISSRPGVEVGASQLDLLSRNNIQGDPIQAIVKSTPNLSAADRLAIYRNAYFLRLVGVFEAEYRVLKKVLGESLFNDFVLLFLEQYPPESYTLHDLSSRFVEFLIESQPEEQRHELWPSFLVELASLERIFQEVYMTEGMEQLSPNDFPAKFSSKQKEWTWFNQAGFARLFKGIFPVHQYLLAVRRGREVDIPAPQATHLIIYRKNYKVIMQEVPLSFWEELEHQ